MSRVPSTHQALTHDQLRTRLGESARIVYARLDEAPTWNPLAYAAPSSVDLGRGLLDSVALALHVLWTYQQAWAEEGFLATARLEDSVSKLLGHIGYRPSPGTAAVGLQHFRCKANVRGTLSAGTAVNSAAEGEETAAVFETLAPLRLSPELNELRAFLPPPVGAGTGAGAGTGGGTGTGGTGGGTGAPSGEPGEPGAPAPTGGIFGPGSVVAGLQERIEVQRHGPLEERQVARAKQDARKLASLMKTLDLGGDAACKSTLDALCEQLCEAQKVVAQAVPPPGRPVGALSESQEILARQLRNLQKRQADALAALEEALAPCADEDPTVHAVRLDKMVTFLDAFVNSLIQEARDQLVILKGSEALNRADQAFGAEAGVARPLGVAASGTDSLYLPPLTDASGLTSQDPPVRPGDWFVLAEDVERLGPGGAKGTERLYREALRVLRVRTEVPPGQRTPMTQVTFQPPLSRAYALDRVVLLGNNTLVSEGSTVEEVAVPALDLRTVPLLHGPVTWLRDPSRAGGRRPEVSLTVGGRAWHPVDSLLDAAPDELAFAVEPLPAGAARLRFGEGEHGSALPLGAEVRVRYRVGRGTGGNRAALRLLAMASPHPCVEKTFNPLPLAGGTDPEAPALARVRGPAAVGAMDRAVSLSDVRALTLVFDGVHRANVFRDGVRRRSLKVVVSGPEGAALGASDLEALHAHLAARVAPKVELHLTNRQRVEVRLRVLLRVVKGADPVAVLQETRLRLGVDRDPEREPGLLDPDRVELGQDLQLSDVYGALAGIEGLRSVVVQRLHREGTPPALFERIVTAPGELLAWAPPSGESDGVALTYEEAQDL
ncbi:hypothetical protein D7X30_26055 [Corallococcus sp. AB011P]|uniref:hypothetical protein n=1 Tax=Corallococcus sp. AB011P TaxID=2316735 RepID=UPI000EA241D8|nr:hypothetical protein [Corallococcus sp. AB011P]RKG55999.1 hypothetical protein D7X30_26055 [Corallococcus sp. AB011P]